MKFVWRRVGQLIVVLFAVTFLSFLMLSLLPGDPAIVRCGVGCDDAAYNRVRQDLGLDRPFIVQYVDWLAHLARFDFGKSLVNDESVSTALSQRMPVTIELMILSQIIALGIAVPLGVYSARKPNGTLDKSATGVGFVFIAVPAFVTGLVLQEIFAVRLHWFPATGYPAFTEDPVGNIHALILPSITLALAEIAVYSRILRTDLVATLQEDYIMMAKAKGLPSRRIMWRHAFRPSTFSLITVLGLRIGALIGGTIIVELVFALNGLGLYVITNIGKRDFIPLQGAVVVIACGYVIINFAVDMFYAVIDPRIRHARSIA